MKQFEFKSKLIELKKKSKKSENIIRKIDFTKYDSDDNKSDYSDGD